jgi:hypothetical protein
LIVRKLVPTILLFLIPLIAEVQTLGGTSVFNFLRLPATPQLTALGGMNVSTQTNDIGVATGNPALLRPSMHTQLNAVFEAFAGTVRNYHVVSGYYLQKPAIMLSLGVDYFNYGATPQTDAAGNILGEFRPNDYVVHVTASRKYGDSWNYGASLKFIQSNYGAYRSSGVALDAGVTWSDTALLMQAGLVLKNMGLQFRAYDGGSRDDLPFDVQAGISKKLAHAPLQFSLTLHHLHSFDIRYNDTAFNNENGYNTRSSFGDKLFSHAVFAAQLFLSEKIEISAGYNYLRRKELNTGNTGNGLNGFSMGVGILIKKIQIRYARTYYQSNRVNNQFGISFSFK